MITHSFGHLTPGTGQAQQHAVGDQRVGGDLAPLRSA
jgi:hypothetical protein